MSPDTNSTQKDPNRVSQSDVAETPGHGSQSRVENVESTGRNNFDPRSTPEDATSGEFDKKPEDSAAA